MGENNNKEFLNTYHFVPVHGRKKLTLNKALPTDDEFRKGKNLGVMDHSIYHADGISGRIECEIETKSPMVIGSEHCGGDGLTKILPYLYEKQPAIPATSLKGMLSSMIEAASNSAMRVFSEKETLSYRMMPGEALSAIGILEEDENGILKLRPLCLPTLIVEKGNWKPQTSVKNPEGTVVSCMITWRNVFPNYARARTYISPGKVDQTKGMSRENYYYMKHWNVNNYNNVLTLSDGLVKKKERSKDIYILGINGLEENVDSEPSQGKERGFIRDIGLKNDNEREIIWSKKYKLFIPYPESAKKNPLVPIDENAIKEFQALANEMSDLDKEEENIRKLKPYLPFGNDQEMAKDRDGKNRVRLREGQLVYFDVIGVACEQGKARPVVSRISFSAIWRKAVVDKERAPVNLRKFFPESSMPFSMDRKRYISVAESMFGFVAKGLKDKQLDATGQDRENPNVAYKGKIRFSMASLKDGQDRVFQLDQHQSSIVDDPKKLKYSAMKVLGSPKLPSPALYFKHKNSNKNDFIQKNSLDPDKHIPQGRKFYVARKHGTEEDWKTEYPSIKPSLKNEVCPIRSNVKFKFHINFDNLTENELDLLCFALHPSADYHHLIGMGKPLGLGKMKITPISLKKINRKKRYSAEGFSSQRFDEGFSGSDIINKAKSCETILDPEVLNALTLMGKGHGGVSLPLTASQKNDEEQTFKWHANNQKQQLKPITGDKIPKLKKN